MVNLSEEEIISRIKHLIYTLIEERKYSRVDIEQIKIQEAIEGLLYLYNKEKEKNKKLEIYENVINNREYTWKQKYEETFDYVKDEFVSKDKIKEKINEHKNNIPYLSKFDDWKEKEYTNEDITNYCIETLEELLGG